MANKGAPPCAGATKGGKPCTNKGWGVCGPDPDAPACPDCAEVEFSNVTLGGSGAIGSFPAWNSGSCTCSTNPNAYSASRTYQIRRITTDTIDPFCDNDTSFFDRELGPPSTWGGNTGSGANAVTITVDDGSNAIVGAVVHITQGANEWLGTTDAFGQVIFALDNNTYGIDIYKPGYDFAATSFTVSGAGSFTFSMTYDGTTGIVSLQWEYENLDYREYLIMPPYLEQQEPPECCWLGQVYIWYAQCYRKRMVDGDGDPYKTVSGNVVEEGEEWLVDCCYCVNNYDVELCFEFFDAENAPTTLLADAVTYTATLTTTAITTDCPGSFSMNQNWYDQPMPLTTPWAKTGLTFTVTDSDGTGYTLALDMTLCPEGV